MKKKIFNAITVIFLLAQIAAEVFLYYRIKHLGIIPQEFDKLFMIGLCAAVLPTVILTLWHVIKSGKIKFVLNALYSMLVIAACLVASFLVMRVDNIMINATDKSREGDIIAVYVNKDDPANELMDAKDYTFIYLAERDMEKIEEAIQDIEKITSSEIKTDTSENIIEAVEVLKKNKDTALILNKAYVDAIVEEGLYAEDISSEFTKYFSEFDKNLKIIYENDAEVIEEVEEEIVDKSKESFIVYISGSDTRKETLVRSRSDVNIVMAVNPITREILLVNTPRDYYVYTSASNFKYQDKLTHCGNFGVDCSISTLENLYNIDIDEYVQINFTGFEKLIDAVGGITITSDVEYTTKHNPTHIHVGENYLDGYKALGVARERYSLSGGDNDRGKNHMRVITAVIEKLRTTDVLENYSQILDSLTNTFATSLSKEEIQQLVEKELNSSREWNITTIAARGTGTKAETYSIPNFNAYVMIPNMESIEEISGMIEDVLAGRPLPQQDK